VTTRYGGIVSRTLALLTDAVLLAFLIAGTAWMAQVLAQQVLRASFVDVSRCSQFTDWWRLRTLVCHGLPLVLPLASFSYPLIYRLGLWTVSGKTAGMALFGLKLLRTDGGRVNFGTAVLRLVGDLLCVFSFGMGFLPILASARRQGLNDRLARTVVVYDWLPEEP